MSRNRSSILKWLPIEHDLRTTDAIISIGHEPEIPKKPTSRRSKAVNERKKHIIHKEIL
jgi:hypothetical protein